jgi:diguanylate cyclase (GGDEF)-like protein/PAS domain S-box-containing protein
MFNYQSKTLITAGFVLILLLMAALAGVSLTHLSDTQEHLKRITEQHNTKADIIFSMRHIVRERAINSYALLILENPFDREEELRRFTGMTAEFTHLRERLMAIGLEGREKDVFDKVLEHVRLYQPLDLELIDKITRERLIGAKQELLRQDLRRQRVLLELLDEMVELERAGIQDATARAAGGYRAAYMTIIVLSVVIIFIGLYVASFVVHRARLVEKALAREKEHAEITLHSVGDAVIASDELGNVNYLNPAAEHMTGWRNEEAQGQPLSTVYKIINETTRKPLEHPAMLGVLDCPIAGLDKHTLLINRSGRESAIEDTAAPIRNGDGDTVGAIVVFRDVTQQRRMQKELSWQASHDALTGLVNRREFEVMLERMLSSVREQDKQHVLLYLDLDQFKVINDTCGHVAGDELLRQITALMLPLIRDSDTLARLGGDEFGILLEGCSIPQAQQIAQKLLQSLEEFRFVWQDKIFRIGVSIGLVGLHAGNGSSSGVMSAADAACYMAKEKGRNRLWVHQDDDHESAQRQGEMEWVSRIMHAFDENRFVLYFQSVMPLSVTADDRSYREVLVRMLDEKGELVPPMAFIPAAERYGVMSSVDRWVVKTAFVWLARHPSEERLAINISSQSLGDEGFLKFVMEQFRATRLSPRRICFEITETAAIANWNRATHFITALRALGCRFALDDFGSGMSSFAYLKNLPIDFIKIDGAFVRDMIDDEVDFAMVEAVNRIGHVMGIRTTAEYVENDEILEKLRELGVDYAQGFGLHIPQPLEPFMANTAEKEVTAEEKIFNLNLPVATRPVG